MTYWITVPSPIVGIDLGTTHSLVARFTGGRVEYLPNDLGETLTPSAVAYDEGSRKLVTGRIAKDIAATRPELAALAFKRDMGTDRKYNVGPHALSAVELSAYVLDALRTDAERALGETVTRAVVTVPAYFDEGQRAATKQAAELAGLVVERMINEPTAAALAYGLAQKNEECRYLVLDLGGGTFDVSVVELFEGMFAVKGVAGESRLGGEDFTQALLVLLLTRVGVDAEAAAAVPKAHALATKRAELLKRKLSRWPRAEVKVPPFEGLCPETSLDVTAEEADAVYRPLLDRMRGPCREALRGAGLLPENLDAVVVVGGATRLACVRDLARDAFGREPYCDPEPDYVIAKGAAIQAALIAEDDAVKDVVLTDVASHTLGVEVTRTVAGQNLSGYFSPILHRNTVIPSSRVDHFWPLTAEQRTIRFGVYEGEARKVADNRLVGELEVRGIPLEGDRTVAVRFTYDLNGLLEVEATVLQTGAVVSAVYQRKEGKMAGAELERAKARLSQLKADPSHRPRYRDLLSRANLLWRDLDGTLQETLAREIDRFDGAMAHRNPAEIEQVFAELNELCRRLDEGERY